VKSSIFAYLLLFFLVGAAPMVTAQPQANTRTVESASLQSDGYLQIGARRGPLTQLLVGVQARMHASLRELMVTVRSGGTEVWMVLMVLGLFYGVIHSLLPGHRKMLLFSYFLSQPAPVRHGVIAGVALGALHALTAVTVVLIGYFVLRLSLSATVEQATSIISRITAVFIVLLGSTLLVTHIREFFGHRHGHSCSRPAKSVGDRGFLTALIASGVVPCPGATMVLLLAVALSAIPAGLVVVVSMSVGMAITLSVLAVLTILFKTRMNALLNSEPGHVLHIVFETGAAAVILVFGLVLLMSPAI
jgi:nickel/cobalt transporter (NicO) family protein